VAAPGGFLVCGEESSEEHTFEQPNDPVLVDHRFKRLDLA